MNTSTQLIENKKDFDVELEYINQLCIINKARIEIINHENISASLTKDKETFIVEVDARLSEDNKDDERFQFKIYDQIYETVKHGNIQRDANFVRGKSAKFKTTIEINSFCSTDFCQKGIFKAFFPLEVKEIKGFHTQFETVNHSRNDTQYPYDCLRIDVNDVQYDVTQLKYNNIGYYVIECLQPQYYEQFSDVCFAIQQAIGFISRLMIGGEKFTFDETGKLCYTNYIRPKIKGMYNPITTNPYSYPDIDRDVSDDFYNRLTRLSLKNLSCLVKKIYNEPEFSAAILVILDATSVRSLLIVPSSFAGIIELLSKHLSQPETGLEKPIPDINLQKIIIQDLFKVVDNYSELLTDASILKLKRRLNDLNKPMNKQHLTNNEILTRPFEQLGIPLTLHDVAIIEHRNDLLHGNILLKNEQEDQVDTNLYMTYVSAKLFTLISKLILKSIGYKGYVYNQAKHLEKYLKIDTGEDFFEVV